jgi:hypothetical protein
MPNRWSFNWESMATKGKESLEMRCVESLLVVYVCVCPLSVSTISYQLYPGEGS